MHSRKPDDADGSAAELILRNEKISQSPAKQRRPRASALDIFDPTSTISQSNFKGLCHLIRIYLVANPLYHKFERGTFWELSIARASFSPFLILMAAWVANFVWALTSFLLFQFYRRGFLSKRQVQVVKHVNQAILVVGMSVWIRYNRMTVFPSTFVLAVTMIHYMKMHSYSASTLDYLEDPIMRSQGFPEKHATFTKYLVYLLSPILVYEIDYPRDPHGFRVGYFVQKTLHLIATLWLIYLVASTMIFPVFEDIYRYSFVHTWARMVVPLFLMDFLWFYMMFECILNMLAEITGFGDRKFYDDWWNCTTWEEWARKWNKPVHEFLLRHVYVPSLKVVVSFRSFAQTDYFFKDSKIYASLATFLFSAILHECFLTVILGVFHPWMFVMMMGQLPLIALSRYHKATTFGNYYFWIGLMLGVPLLSVVYGRHWAIHGGACPPP